MGCPDQMKGRHKHQGKGGDSSNTATGGGQGGGGGGGDVKVWGQPTDQNLPNGHGAPKKASFAQPQRGKGKSPRKTKYLIECNKIQLGGGTPLHGPLSLNTSTGGTFYNEKGAKK